MAGTDHGLALRGGVIAKLLATPAFVAMSGDRIYGGQPKAGPAAWPFTRVDISDSQPDEASGWIGEDGVWTVNFFTMPTDDLPDAEAECRKGVKIIKRALDGEPLALELEAGEDGPVPYAIEVFVRSTTVGVDRGEPGAYHGRVEFSSKTAEEA